MDPPVAPRGQASCPRQNPFPCRFAERPIDSVIFGRYDDDDFPNRGILVDDANGLDGLTEAHLIGDQNAPSSWERKSSSSIDRNGFSPTGTAGEFDFRHELRGG